MGVVHGEVGDDHGDRQRHHKHAGHGAHRAHEHSQVGLGHHVTEPHSGHRDKRPPQPQWDGLEVIVRVDLENYRNQNVFVADRTLFERCLERKSESSRRH